MILFGSTFSQSSSTQLANRLARLAQFICQTLFMPSINWIVLSLNHFSGGFPCLVWIPQSLNTPLGFSHLAWGISTLNLEPLNLKHSFGVLTLSLRSFHAQHENYEPQPPFFLLLSVRNPHAQHGLQLYDFVNLRKCFLQPPMAFQTNNKYVNHS